MLELLKELLPQISRVAVLWNPDHADPEYRETQRVAATLRVQLQPLRCAGPKISMEHSSRQSRVGLRVSSSYRLAFSSQRQKIIEFTTDARIPGVGSWGDCAKDGLTLTYGPNTDDAMRRIAMYVDKILKGTRPADLPIERPLGQ
jgi:putative ABC transport system substrate-binding protein